MKFLIGPDNIPISYFNDDHKFTLKEASLNIVQYDATREDVRFIMQYCYWDVDKFVLLVTDKPFDSIKNKLDSINANNFDKKPDDKDKDKELQDAHVSYCDEKDLEILRRRYAKKAASTIDVPGFDRLLSALKYGCYGDIAGAFQDLPAESKQVLLDGNIWSEEDKNLLLNVWKVF